MEPEQHLRALDAAGAVFAEMAAAAPPGAAIATCPGWNVEDLILHLGKVHRWAATIVGRRLERTLRFDRFDAAPPAAARELVPWFREGHAGLLRTLREAPADLDCWTFLPAATARAFWCRRQAHETAMHLADLALAVGRPADQPGWDVPPAFAADGVDELLQAWMRGKPPGTGEDPAPSLRVAADDDALDWQFGFPGPRGVTLVPAREASQPPACTVRARAVDLYLLLWNRRSGDGLQVEGDATLLERWAADRHI